MIYGYIDHDILSRHRRKAAKLRQLEELIQRIEARIADPPTARLCDMPGHSSGVDTLSRDIANLNALRELHSALWDEIIDERDTISHALARLSARERTLIISRYFDGMSWKGVAGRLGCSEDYARGHLRSEVFRKINHNM